jgi:hypothetical protein
MPTAACADTSQSGFRIMTTDELKVQKGLAYVAVEDAKDALKSASNDYEAMLSAMTDAMHILERTVERKDESGRLRGAPAGVVPKMITEDELLRKLKPYASFLNVDAIVAVYARKTSASEALREAERSLAVFGR